MTRTQNTIAATFAALLIGGLMINPASAAVKRSDISSVTHGAISVKADQVSGRYEEFSRADISSVTHRAVPVGANTIGKTSAANYSSFDLNSITNN